MVQTRGDYTRVLLATGSASECASLSARTAALVKGSGAAAFHRERTMPLEQV